MSLWRNGVFISTLLLLNLFGLPTADDSENTQTQKPVDDEEATRYLMRFGYLRPAAMQRAPVATSAVHASSDHETVASSMRDAIKQFQEFAGLEPSGTLDVTTRKKMAEPRCGFYDVFALSRYKQQILKWNKQQLAYSIHRYTNDMDQNKIRIALRHAFQVWSQVVPLNFTELADEDENADIRISFLTGSHGDGSPFDGPGGILAHATLPTDGLLHFDDSERWVYMDASQLLRGSTDLLSVGIHEIGHVLGLPHFPVRNAIMAPFYQDPVDEDGEYQVPQLSKVDITAIQEIYGVRRNIPSWPTTTVSPPESSYGDFFDRLWSKWFGGSGDGSSVTPRRRTRIRTTTTAPPESPTEPMAPDAGDTETLEECPLSVDAITEGMNGKKYVFDGTRVYELRGVKITKMHSLQELFPGGPPIVKAALSEHSGRHIWLLHGFTVYEYRWNPLARRYRLDLESPETLPEDMEFKPSGGMQWPNGRQLLFSCCGDIGVYDPVHNEVSATGKLVESLPEFPYGVKGGFTSLDRKTVLLFTASRIYKYDTEAKARVGDAFRIREVLLCRHT